LLHLEIIKTTLPYGTRKMSAVLVACCGMVYFEIVRCLEDAIDSIIKVVELLFVTSHDT
jgi:hypothetical protein